MPAESHRPPTPWHVRISGLVWAVLAYLYLPLPHGGMRGVIALTGGFIAGFLARLIWWTFFEDPDTGA